MNMSKKTKKLISGVLLGATLFGGMGGTANAGGFLGELWDNAKEEIKISIDDSISGTLKRGNQNIQNKNAINQQSGKFNYGLDSAAQTRNYQLQNNTVCTTTSRNNTKFGSNGKTTTSGNINQTCSDRTYTRNIERDMNKSAQLNRQQADWEQKRLQRLQIQADRDARVLRLQRADAERTAIYNAKQATKQFQSNAKDMQQSGGYGSNYYQAPKQQSQDSGSYKQTQQTQTYKVTGAARYQ